MATSAKGSGDFVVNLSESEEEEKRTDPNRKSTKTGGKNTAITKDQGEGKGKSTKKDDPTQRQGITKQTDTKQQSTHRKEKENECRILVRFMMAAPRTLQTEGEEVTGARPQPKAKKGAASGSQDEEHGHKKGNTHHQDNQDRNHRLHPDSTPKPQQGQPARTWARSMMVTSMGI